MDVIFQAEKAVSAKVRRSERTQNTVELTGNRSPWDREPKEGKLW